MPSEQLSHRFKMKSSKNNTRLIKTVAALLEAAEKVEAYRKKVSAIVTLLNKKLRGVKLEARGIRHITFPISNISVDGVSIEDDFISARLIINLDDYDLSSNNGVLGDKTFEASLKRVIRDTGLIGHIKMFDFSAPWSQEKNSISFDVVFSFK